uniref:F-box domain-containing protein n=1 Tax=Steinernema glaseri TaxID=37863 RepID=A0A1I7ZHX3_9BILA
MDGLPHAFCDHLCDITTPGTVFAMNKLSGYYGYSDTASYTAAVQDGMEEPRHLWYYFTRRKLLTPEEIEAVPKKVVHRVRINLWDAKDENGSAYREIIKRYPHAKFQFGLYSSSINEAWVSFACLLKRLDNIVINMKLEDDVIPLLKKLVNGRKHSWLVIKEEACEGPITEVLKSLFCQDNFEFLNIETKPEGPWKSTVVGDLLQLWPENSQKLRGKSLLLSENCKDGVKQLQDFVLDRGAASPDLIEPYLTYRLRLFGLNFALKVCSKEECDFIDKYHRRRFVTFDKPSCIYKYEEDDGDERRRIYISFECATESEQKDKKPRRPASHNGHNDLGLMPATTYLRLLFA